jgi:hypothetical protein
MLDRRSQQSPAVCLLLPDENQNLQTLMGWPWNVTETGTMTSSEITARAPLAQEA